MRLGTSCSGGLRRCGDGRPRRRLSIPHDRSYGPSACFIAAGSVNLREFGALLACANLVVTNSTGPSIWRLLWACHGVCIFRYSDVSSGPLGPLSTFVEGSGDHVVITAPAAAAGDELESEMAGVSVEQVMARLRVPLSWQAYGSGRSQELGGVFVELVFQIDRFDAAHAHFYLGDDVA